MAGLTNQIAAALAVEAAAISGVTGASATPVNSIPDTPYVYIGPPRVQQVPGSWESRIYTFPMHYLVARVSGDEAADQAVINDALDAVLNAWRTGVTLGGLGIAEIVAADGDKFYTVATQEYQSVDFDVRVSVYGAGGYTA